MTTSPETFSASDPDAGIRVAALYEAHGRTILGLCRFLLRDPTEAEDAAQQSFLSAYRSLLGGVVPREPVAWLAAIARNECWLRIKRRMREPLMLHEVPSPQADPLEAAARNADFAALRAGLEALSRPQREAFMLREFAGLSYSELALALGVTEPAVDSLLFRARTSLRRALSAANGILVPVALRDQLARLIPGFDSPAVGTLAKLASLPIAAKLAAAGAGAVLVVAGSAGVGGQSTVAAREAVRAPVARLQRAVTTVQAPSSGARPVSVPRATYVAHFRGPVAPARQTLSVAELAITRAPEPRPHRGNDIISLAAPAGSDAEPTESGAVPVAAPLPPRGAGVPTAAGEPTDGTAATSPAPTQAEPSSGKASTEKPRSESPEPPEAPETPETSTTPVG